jgi:hypothetical protein
VVAMVLGEDWAKGWEAFEFEAMHFLLPIFWVVEEQAEGHASKCHLMNQCFAGSKSQH